MKQAYLFLLTAKVVMSLSVFGHDLILPAIAKVETGASRALWHQVQKADSKVGKDGEISRFQFQRKLLTPHEVETMPIPSTVEYVHWSEQVAKRILEERLTRFHTLHLRTPSNAEIYILWHRPAYLIYSYGKKPIPPIVKKRAAKFAEVVGALSRGKD